LEAVRLGGAFVGVLLAALLACSVAQARQFETVLQDDALVLHRPTQQVERTLRRARALGVDRLRVTAVWQEIAPKGSSRTRPRFIAYRPRQYPAASWAPLDRAVVLARRAGLKVMIDVGFWAPLWASQPRRGQTRGVRNVSPIEFGYFAFAVAKRYDGTFKVGRGRLPRVDTFTVWNEPNHPGFLQPQWQGDVPVAADQYRTLVYAAYPQIKAAQRSSRVLIGGLAPGGDDTGLERRAVPPLAFLRRLACVDEAMQPVRDGGCRNFVRVPADGLAHHPYNLHRLPGVSPGVADWATIADLDALQQTVTGLVESGRLAPGARSIWLTEFGYETNDSVASKPWTPEQQARLLPWAERLAYEAPMVVSFPQFLMADIETKAARAKARAGSARRAPGSWQTGLYTERGGRKPAAVAFRLALDPLLTRTRQGLAAHLFGHVRPARGPALVTVQWQRKGRGWQTARLQPDLGRPAAGEMRTRPDGTFDAWIRLPEGRRPGLQFRLLWRHGGAWHVGQGIAPRHERSLG
jgi:hypothetical protein